MSTLDDLLSNNRDWADRIRQEDPGFFKRLSKQQSPKYLWIGCSDSRVPANQILGLDPGEVFVHRNIANVVVHADLNCLSVIQFAVDLLKVEHILVVGHYGCSGVHASLTGSRIGLADNWLRHVGDVAQKHMALLEEVELDSLRHARLCELNAIEQVVNVCQTTVLQDAWARGQQLSVHGWVYSLHDGRVRNMGMDVASPEQLAGAYETALARLSGRPGADV
ncbi:carbonate dehydratase [Lysobacter sp. CFH 32150]|uniref:carbonate dehydratase n=1 Tax=Lysobacter sp. CFH 32150 TaxID=2927128 RepID=UPI001FA6E858|nr:carbonate dehydratase [Lysobacter sp. CFH 32150]MCI4567088.1 carbonate dehydratase [Lysobacter sp. CFH 32150]